MQLQKLVLFVFILAFPILYASKLLPRYDPLITDATRFQKMFLEKIQHTEGNDSVSTEWFEQKLDHFNPADQRTFQQRYFALDSYYKPGGPVFLMVGGESAANKRVLDNTPNFSDTGKKVNAFLFDLEHRFYGETHPTEDLSLENLKYLTSEQALADAANFIIGMNEKYNFPPKTKWIAFGGSYAGVLAAWLRLKYPHLVFGAISSSAPLQATVNYEDYYHVVEDSIRSHSVQCLDEIRKSFQELIDMSQEETKRGIISSTFLLCDKLKESFVNYNKNLTYLYTALMYPFATTVQYDDYIADNTTTLDSLCEIMLVSSEDPSLNRLERLAKIVRGSDPGCLDYNYDFLIELMTMTKWENGAAFGGVRQWRYQTCVEFGLFPTASDTFLNYVNINYYEEYCTDVFGPSFNKTFLQSAIKQTNAIYGGTDIEVKNVVFVNGRIDPWHPLGLFQTRHPLSPAIFIEGASHCANMHPIGKYTPPQMVEAIGQINDILYSWLNL